jgi:hypothetical protein
MKNTKQPWNSLTPKKSNLTNTLDLEFFAIIGALTGTFVFRSSDEKVKPGLQLFASTCYLVTASQNKGSFF